MKNCEACKKTLEGAKARTVDLEGRRTLLCGGCGRIEFLDEKGEKRVGLLQALGRVVRRSHGGRSVTFHAEFPLVKGQVLRDATASALPTGTRPITNGIRSASTEERPTSFSHHGIRLT